MEYFYGDALRWGFGFDNPNKAAVLFACGLPLCWMLCELAWRLRSRWARIVGLLLATALVLADGFLLFKTYSRGGVVGAAAALAYLLVRMVRLWKWKAPSIQLCGRIALIAALALMAWRIGLLDRVAQPMETADASVEHRLVLWKSALQMAADNPMGFGVGNSGNAYMDWYQPIEMTAGYRTMVNSYLTALVEWGWPTFALAVLGCAFLWGWANPGKQADSGGIVASGLRAALVAFAVSGIFSTTMESWVLWMLPGLCAAILVIWALGERRSMTAAIPAVAVSIAACLAFFLYGHTLSDGDPLKRTFSQSKPGGQEITVRSRNGDAGKKWTILPDTDVLGEDPGRLLRPLALKWGETIDVGGNPQEGARLILSGNAVRQPVPGSLSAMVLLAPATMDEAAAHRLLTAAPVAKIFVPDIDEDGRAEFWRNLASNQKNVEVVAVQGVGKRLDWGWDQVVEEMPR